jgi:hypothetical protein
MERRQNFLTPDTLIGLIALAHISCWDPRQIFHFVLLNFVYFSRPLQCSLPFFFFAIFRRMEALNEEHFRMLIFFSNKELKNR